MATAAELRAEAAHLRESALIEKDPGAFREINLLIAELEWRARLLSNGDATDD